MAYVAKGNFSSLLAFGNSVEFSAATTFPFRGKCCANIILSVGPEFREKKGSGKKKKTVAIFYNFPVADS